jgi:hypothetical protein
VSENRSHHKAVVGSGQRPGLVRCRGWPAVRGHLAGQWEPDGNHDGCETSSYAASVAVTATERVALTRHDGCGTRKAGIF